MIASSEWWSSGWVMAGLLLLVSLHALHSIGISLLVVYILRRDAERAGGIVLAIDNPSAPRKTRPRRGIRLAVLSTVLIVALGSLIALTSHDLLYLLLVAAMLLSLAVRQIASTIGRLKYCPPYVEIRENGLLYPSGQPLHFIPWDQVRWYAVRPYRSAHEREFRLIVQAPAHCQNLPVREDQVAQIESCLSEYLIGREQHSEVESL